MSVFKYLARLPGVPEIIGLLVHILRRAPLFPRQLRATIARLCATHMALPAYVRRFAVNVGDTRIILAARPQVSMIGLAFYVGLDDFEKDTVAVVASLARTAQVVVDVGANAGVYSLLVSHIQPRARVVAIEPQPLAAMSLVRSAKVSQRWNIEVYAIALGSSEGLAPLFTTPSDTLTSLEECRVPDAARLMVAVSTLDALAASQRIAGVDLLKMDVEGRELDVLRGAKNTIRRDRPVIVFEVLADAPAQELADFFAACDYKVFRPQAGSLVPATPGPTSLGAAEHNLVGVPGERIAEVFEALSVIRPP